jgi:hypothetical protein
MKIFPTNKINEDAVPVAEEPTVRRPDLTPNMVHGFLRHILQSLESDADRWRGQLACTPRGADFDLRDEDDGTTVLDRLAMTGDSLGEAIARGDAPAEVGQGVLPHLAAPLEALAERREAAKSDAKQTVLLKRYGPVLHRLVDDVSGVGRGMADLSGVAARGAASLDPDASRRVFDRMRNVGDATMRLIEDRIASAGTRDKGKRLRALRDDLKTWIEERNVRLEQIQTAVDELQIRSNALRNESLMQAKRLAAAAAMTRQAPGDANAAGSVGAAEQASPEAMVLSAVLRALLLEGRTDIAASPGAAKRRLPADRAAFQGAAAADRSQPNPDEFARRVPTS